MSDVCLLERVSEVMIWVSGCETSTVNLRILFKSDYISMKYCVADGSSFSVVERRKKNPLGWLCDNEG